MSEEEIQPMEVSDTLDVQIPELVVQKAPLKSEAIPASDIDLDQAFIQHTVSLDRQSEYVSVSMTCKEQIVVSKTDTIESLPDTEENVQE